MNINDALKQCNDVLQMKNLREFLTGDQVMALNLLVRSVEHELSNEEKIVTISVSHVFELLEVENVEQCISEMYKLFISKLLEEKLLQMEACDLIPGHKVKVTYKIKVVNDKQDYSKIGLDNEEEKPFPARLYINGINAYKKGDQNE